MHMISKNISAKTKVEAISVLTVTESNVADAVAVEVLAFNTDPMTRWLYPEPHQYLTYFPQFVRLFGGKAFEHDTAYYIQHIGAALWLPPGIAPDAEAFRDHIQQSVAAHKQADLFAVLEQMGHYHPHEPHWYLALIGVEPSHQGKGYGTALVQKILQECDRAGTPAYLESSNPINVPFYEQFGFESIGTIQAGTSPTMQPMIRYPK
jgi:GNAT superfamily N-acetyltransferase